MRDKIKDIQYFSNYIDFEKQRLEKWDKLIANTTIESGETDAVKKAQYSQFMYSYQMLIASYSAGVTLVDIRELYITTLAYAVKGWNKIGGYYQMLWMLSIGILLKIPISELKKLVALIERDKLEDYLIDYLISSFIPNRPLNNHLDFNTPYQSIAEATISNLHQAQFRIKQYLEKEWYQGHGDTYWFNNHKSKHDTYFGYWCFESAVITAIMQLDDSSYQKQQYYPKDLIDYYKQKT